MRLNKSLVGSLLVLTVLAAGPSDKTYLNLDRKGLALQGYDPVSYIVDNKAVKGSPNITAVYRGGVYRFATEEHRTTFRADPAKYEPQFGGWCGYAVSKGETAEIDPEAFIVQDGRLILQYSKSVLATWKKDAAGYLKKADANWPKIVAKNTK